MFENDFIKKLEQKFDATWPNIQNAGLLADEKIHKLELIFEKESLTSLDTSIIVFGSIARKECTSGSDLDWSFIVDGQANSKHKQISKRIGELLEKNKTEFPNPNPTGHFGGMDFSHELIHNIGGDYDTNENMTRRILLLLEPLAIGKNDEAFQRIITGIIGRYLEEETRLAAEKYYKIPRFLLNDIVRFWRTMAVDFARKQREEKSGEKWGIRNIKLRMSRKLLFVSGLLTCFSCSKLEIEDADKEKQKPKLIEHIREYVQMPPLQVVARSFLEDNIGKEIAVSFFESYDKFLEIIHDARKRSVLEALTAETAKQNVVFQEAQGNCHRFQETLDRLFLDTDCYKSLTRKYAIF